VTSYAALLRGVNVGGRGPLPMATVRDALAALGYASPVSYLQSGNVVFGSPDPPEVVESRVRQALLDATGREIGVLVRTAAELRAVVAGWPFEPAPPTTRHVVFVRGPADAARLVDGLAARDLLPDRLAVAGAHVYLSLPGGLGRSRLAARLAGRQQRAGATTRNWTTVTALRERAAALGENGGENLARRAQGNAAGGR
jgi:uncharacterized protein (DUF1697 family)